MVTVKKVLQSLYKGTCTVYEYGPVKDPATKITSNQELEVLVDQPCRLSHKSISQVNESQGANVPVQIIKLFMDPDVVIKAGSKIVVTQDEKTRAYKNVGEPAYFTNHQELVMELFKDWA